MSVSKGLRVSIYLATYSALLCSLTSAAHADVVQTRIFRIEAPAAPGQEHQILATQDGRVYFVPGSDKALLSRLQDFKNRNSPASLILDGDRIVDAQPLTGAVAAEYSDSFDQPRVAAEASKALGSESQSESETGTAGNFPASLIAARIQGYEPSILKSIDDVQALFHSERELNHHSQCYERAEIWTREFQQSYGVSSMKVFMFFTEKFRKRFTHNILFVTRPYKWWFHVAPFVYSGNQEYVLDREFLNQAVAMNDWTFKFIGQVEHDNKEVANPTQDEALCLDAPSYAQYSEDSNPARYCVLRKVPMYYFQPLDVEALDCQAGTLPGAICERTFLSGWRDTELKRAYKDTAK